MADALVPYNPPGALVPVEKRAEQLETALQELWNSLESPCSRRSYTADWRRFCAWITRQRDEANVKLHPLTARPLHVQRYISTMHARGLSKATRARALSVLKQVYAALVRAELILVNPAREAKNLRVSSEPRTPWMSEEELRCLLARPVNPSRRARMEWLVLITLLGTGLRRSEVARLAVEQLAPGPIKGLTARVRAKGGKEALVVLPTWLSTELVAWIRDEGITAGPLFRLKGRRAISGSTVYNIVKDAADRAGVDPRRATPHAVRRSFTTLTGLRGVSLEDRQAALLHSDKATTERYDKSIRLAQTAPGEVLADLLEKKP